MNTGLKKSRLCNFVKSRGSSAELSIPLKPHCSCVVEILIKAMSSVSEALIRHSAFLKASQGCGYKSLNEQHSEENQVLANYSFYSSQSIIVSVFSTLWNVKGCCVLISHFKLIVCINAVHSSQ